MPCLLLALWRLSQLSISNDVRTFYLPEAQLKNQEDQIKSLLKQHWQLGYFIVESATEQGVLQQEEQVVQRLNQLVLQDKITDISAISQWLPAVQSQQRNHEILQQALAKGQFQALQQMLPQMPWEIRNTITPLTPEVWLQSAHGMMYQSQWFVDTRTEEKMYYSVVRIAGNAEVAELKALANTLSLDAGKQSAQGRVYFIDKTHDISSQLTTFSEQLVWLLLAAVSIAFVVFYLRYGLYGAVLGIITPIFAVAIALLLSDVMLGSLNIFNLVAAILIIALGLDYSVFYAEHGLAKKMTLTTLMSALSSVFVFAMLMFSSMSVIASFGVTIFIGVLCAFLFAPIVVLAKSRSKLSKEGI